MGWCGQFLHVCKEWCGHCEPPNCMSPTDSEIQLEAGELQCRRLRDASRAAQRLSKPICKERSEFLLASEKNFRAFMAHLFLSCIVMKHFNQATFRRA